MPSKVLNLRENGQVLIHGLGPRLTRTANSLRFLYYFKLKVKLFATKNRAQVELPKLPSKPEDGPVLVEVYDELQTKHTPKVRECDVATSRF